MPTLNDPGLPTVHTLPARFLDESG
jgi:hypothetical protein